MFCDGASKPASKKEGQILWKLQASRWRRVQKYKRTLRPAHRAVAAFIYHYHRERNHQGLWNAFVFFGHDGILGQKKLEILDTMLDGKEPVDGPFETYRVESSWTHALLTSSSTMASRSMMVLRRRSTPANGSSETSKPCTTSGSLASGQRGSLLFPPHHVPRNSGDA